MRDTVIKAENLGKKYVISHKQEYYSTLRDVIANKVKNIGRKKFETGSKEEFWALKDVSFEIKQGDRVGIIGRNGAGKSTLLKILSRITQPSAGNVALKGRISSLLEVGTGFHPELTGRENIYLNGAILGMSRQEIKRKFDEIVEFAEVEKFLDTPVKRYSSGMYVKLAFSVAAHLEPEILIVDEVLAVGDAQFQKKSLGKMEDVGRNGRTVMFVSHNMAAVQQLCNSAMVLSLGEISSYSYDVSKEINSYLTQGSNFECIWKNPKIGNEFVDIWMKALYFCARDKSGNIISKPISNKDEIYIDLSIDIKKVDPNLYIGYIITSESGIEIMKTYITDTDEEHWPKFKKGVMTLRSELPKFYLNEGRYKVTLEASIRHKDWIYNPSYQSPSFWFEIMGGISTSPYWTEKRQAVLAPVVKWDVIKEAHNIGL